MSRMLCNGVQKVSEGNAEAISTLDFQRVLHVLKELVLGGVSIDITTTTLILTILI